MAGLHAFEGVRPIRGNNWFSVSPVDPGNWPVTPWMGQGPGFIQPQIVAMDLRSQAPMQLPPPARGRARGPVRQQEQVLPPPPEEEGSPDYSSSESPYDESGMIDTEIVSMQLEGRKLMAQATIPVFQWPGHTALVLGPSSWGVGIGVWPGTAHAVAPFRFPSQSLWF